jgi:hypothetical protein
VIRLSATVVELKLRITSASEGEKAGVPNGIRTRVAAVKGRCPRPLDDGDVPER